LDSSCHEASLLGVVSLPLILSVLSAVILLVCRLTIFLEKVGKFIRHLKPAAQVTTALSTSDTRMPKAKFD
jgi:hypothetical protein